MSEALARSLVERALAGELSAVRRLVAALTPVIQARVARILMRCRAGARGREIRQEVEDLSQEVFVALLENDGRVLRSWDPDRGMSLQNFAGLVAERQAISILRSGRRSPWTEDPTLSTDLDAGRTSRPPTPEGRVAGREFYDELLDRVRQALSPKGLQLFELIVLEERSVEEVCAEVGMTTDAVYAWRSRLMKLLRKLRADILSESSPPARMPVQPGGDR
ncbi:MAG: sigma-70 family RNA polymerase sigma factor [bacterium]